MKREEIDELKRKANIGSTFIYEIDKIKEKIESLKDIDGVLLKSNKSATKNWSIDANPALVQKILELIREDLNKKLDKLEEGLEKL